MVQSRHIPDTDFGRHHVYERGELLHIADDENGAFLGYGTMIKKSVIHEDFILFTTQLDNLTYLRILRLNDTNTIETGENSIARTPTVRTLSKHTSEITAIGVCDMAQRLHSITTELIDDSTALTFTSIDGSGSHTMQVPTLYSGKNIDIGEITSIALSYKRPGFLTLLCGTRKGLLLTGVMNISNPQEASFSCDRFGLNEAVISKDVHRSSKDLYFVVCDSRVYAFTPNLRRPDIHQIWLTDALRPGLNQPDINAIARLRPNFSGGADGGILMVASTGAGSQLLLAAFSTQGKMVPRSLAVKGTPTRLLYSHTLDVLIVGAIVNGRSTLLLIDPDTGKDLCVPWDAKNSTFLEHPKYLGGTNESIYHLLEWSYIKDDRAFFFIIVGTSSGRLLIMKPIEYQDNNGPNPGRPKYKIYTNYSWNYEAPIYSVVGVPGGLLWCSGQKLHYDILGERKDFKRMAEYELLSPATSLIYEDGVIYALTNCHSLEILKVVQKDNGQFEIVQTHVDDVARNTLHHGIVKRGSEMPIHLVSDKHSSVVGLWPTRDTKADGLETIFEAELAHSVLKFRQGRCRPVWDSAWKSPLGQSMIENGRPSDAPETLSLSINGSLCHSAVLSFEAWRFLRFILELSLRSPKVCEFSYKDDEMPLEPATSPKIMMHIDGDILKRCMDGCHLEELLRIDEDPPEHNEIYNKFLEILQTLHQGGLAENAEPAVYVEQAYQDLWFFLRPVL